MRNIAKLKDGLIMNKTEKELKANRDQLLAQLKECDDKLNAIKAQKDKEAEIKRNYKPNYIEPRYEMLWKQYAIDLENLLVDIVSKVDEALKDHVGAGLEKARKKNSYQVPTDPSKIWNCPNCGEHDSLYIGVYTSDEFHIRYAVTCSSCDYVGPKLNDSGEAWTEFEEWLRKKGYLKDEN